MAAELHLRLNVVVPDGTALATVLGDLAGRELPGVPGSWIVSAEQGAVPVPLPSPEPELWQDVLDAEDDADDGIYDF